MSSRNYLVNFEDLSLMERKGYKLGALAAGIERCAIKSIGTPNADIPGLEAIPESNKYLRVKTILDFINGAPGIPGSWPKSIDQRELATGPALNDFTAGSVTALDEMVTAPLAIAGVPYSCFQAVGAPQLLVGKLLVFFGISVEAAPNPASYLLFRKGGIAGNIQARFDLQGQSTRLAYDAFFSEPVIIDPSDVFAVQVICRIPGPAARIHLHNFLFEGTGEVIA